ncbi:hypothetical protein FQZ97_1258090 [compost metagenome]
MPAMLFAGTAYRGHGLGAPPLLRLRIDIGSTGLPAQFAGVRKSAVGGEFCGRGFSRDACPIAIEASPARRRAPDAFLLPQLRSPSFQLNRSAQAWMQSAGSAT